MTTKMIRKSAGDDFEIIHFIINDASKAYKGVIPSDCWKEPYMSRDELLHEIKSGVVFWLYEADDQNSFPSNILRNRNEALAVMGVQHVQDVSLIRHAYVRTSKQNQGIGGGLLEHIKVRERRPLLVGTWKDAQWAVRFYEKHCFSLVTPSEVKDKLLKKYWTVSKRQIEESVVLADEKWFVFVHS
jgi:GNAT superfamily N-acetyltransferase